MSPNLTRTWFLKVSSNVDSESIPMNFFVLYYSKIGLLPMQDFVTSRFGSFWKYWFYRFCKCWHIIQHQNITFINLIFINVISPQISIKKSREAIKLNVTDANSPKSNFHLKGQILSLATNLVRFFFNWRDMFILFLFNTMCIKYSISNNLGLSVILSSKHDVPLKKKKASSACNVKNPQVLFQRQQSSFKMQKCFMWTSHVISTEH